MSTNASRPGANRAANEEISDVQVKDTSNVTSSEEPKEADVEHVFESSANRTFNELVKAATLAYLDGIDPAKPPTPAQIERELLAKVNRSISTENLSRDKRDQLPRLTTLTHSQIAALIARGGRVAMVQRAGLRFKPGPSSLKTKGANVGRDLAVFVTNPADAEYGLWSFDGRHLRTMIQAFNWAADERTENAVIHRLYSMAGRVDAKGRALVPVLNECTSVRYVPVANGVFDRETRGLIPYSCDLVFTAKVPHRFIENCPEPAIVDEYDNDGYVFRPSEWEDTLSDDPEVVAFLRDVRRALFNWNHPYEKVIMPFNSGGANGKGTWAGLLKRLLGSDNVSALSIDMFSQRFPPGDLIGKWANIGDETSVGAYVPAGALFKSYATGDTIYVETKGVQGVAYDPCGMCISPLNGYARFKDKSPALLRRLVYLPFTGDFKQAPKRHIKNDYLQRPEVLEWYLWDSLMHDVDVLVPPAASQRLLDEFQQFNDSVVGWWTDRKDVFPLTWTLLPFAFLYDDFRPWDRKKNPSGDQISFETFSASLRLILATDDIWMDRSKGSAVSTKKTMPTGASSPMFDEHRQELESWIGRWQPGRSARSLAMQHGPSVRQKMRGAMRRDYAIANGLLAPDAEDDDD